jgi:hypothetical protein
MTATTELTDFDARLDAIGAAARHAITEVETQLKQATLTLIIADIACFTDCIAGYLSSSASSPSRERDAPSHARLCRELQNSYAFIANPHLPVKVMLGRGCARLADSSASFQAAAASLLS